ncbi:hypothetical protein [Butyrivibrio sp. JL13D10]|uniref:hypothetical protein n=1 Tax=Butyrivibrio sp. JL13D10 TaxID=3236815 RepID=UPI0038B48759
MRNKIVTMLMATLMLTSLTACGMMGRVSTADDNNKDESEVIVVSEDKVPKAASAENKADSEDVADVGWETFKSKDGWSVSYDSGVIEVQDNTDPADEISFNYTGKQAGTNCLVISYIKDKLPDKVMDEIKDSQGSDTKAEVTGGYFPGSIKNWAYWIDFTYPEEGSGLKQSYILGEYNGGTLEFMFLTHKSGDEEMDMAASDALAMIIDSIQFENFKPQTMYKDIPGDYVLKETEEIEGEELTFERTLSLKEDHTGTMSIQDDFNILWDDKVIMADDGSFTYNYTLKGDKLTIDYDGAELVFTKK